MVLGKPEPTCKSSSSEIKQFSPEIMADENPILTAARRGDAKELERLLGETVTGEPFICPEDWKYRFSDLIQCDHNMQSPLHLAASIGNHETALHCIQLLLDNDQMAFTEPEYGDYEKKSKYLIDLKDKYGETALHLAIDNKAARVVAHLIERKAAVTLKSKEGTPALTLIYQKVPDAMKEIYDNSIELTDDFKGLDLDFGPIIGYHNTLKEDLAITAADGGGGESNNEGFQKIPIHEFQHKDLEFWKETEYLSLILKADKWGASLLQHCLVKYFLHLKWRKIHKYFYMSFFYHTLWLLLYATAFVDLHSKVDTENKTVANCIRNATEENPVQCQHSEEPKICYCLWYFLFLLTLSMTAKEIYQASSLCWSYLSFENGAQILFIILYFTQFTLLMTGYPEIVASISVVAVTDEVGILLSTILMICQLGKTPFFGLQVAALIRVVYSCKPHIFLFIVWFLGFGLAFWALFYKMEDRSILRMPAIVTGMAAGELNMSDLMEKLQSESLSLQVFSVICLVVFIIIIVTLYFNLLIGYAVSDIQLLKSKAEVLELSNRLSTIYTTESFLLSNVGQKIVHGMSTLTNLCSGKKQIVVTADSEGESSCESPFDFLYVIPRKKFKTTSGQYKARFDEIPEKILERLKEIAYNNLLQED